jgi:DNA-binding XRE family transcriptional regulator
MQPAVADVQGTVDSIATASLVGWGKQCKEEMIMKLQDKILYCRKKAGLSQEQLAERIGVSRQAISKWETGDAVPEIS